MRIGCNICGKPVSSEVPDDTIVRAWVECPECIEKQPDETSNLSSDKEEGVGDSTTRIINMMNEEWKSIIR